MAERLDDLCASFKRHLRAEKKAARTATLYGMSVRMFSDWLLSCGRPATLDELTRSAIREWLVEIGETRQASTVLYRATTRCRLVTRYFSGGARQFAGTG